MIDWAYSFARQSCSAALSAAFAEGVKGAIGGGASDVNEDLVQLLAVDIVVA